ncbi:hypothetical protein PV326_007340 [Microctonus aethiopoides]|uniref:EF-hand domain-containing protein n=1 Tax=Microctonus aethiopoides TaxID=144406 RepID=A0AA39C4I5_9HYME|nr:hypothetical protein PV326_007340 [Microctonus aethiopoides]KAK0157677.1 hypothetical protein PV328_011386 [Microctonus aethiopoides]
MMNWIFWLFIIGHQLVVNTHGQRVAPGVPPQHYQQAPQGQVYQQQQPIQHQQQYQQPPIQQQQHVPIQQQTQHVPMDHHASIQHQQNIPVQQQQNIPVQQQGHNHGHNHAPQQLLNAANIQHEREHIAEHAEVPLDTSKMSEEELQFHYFKMHDADNNNKLDGCELIKSLIHWHEQGKTNTEGNVQEKLFQDEELTNLIDPILNTDDENKDGYIDYPEFIRAQKKAAGKGNP